jgi:transcriptional regulator with XRE-family HTH domain
MLEDATSLNEFFVSETREPGSVRAALGPRIRRARLERLQGLNLEVFGRRIAELMGRRRAFSNVTISNWETGRQEPSFEALIAIAHLTHLPLRYFAGVGEMEEYPYIDWLAEARVRENDPLRGSLMGACALSPAARELVFAHLRSLISDIYRVQHGSQNVAGGSAANR